MRALGFGLSSSAVADAAAHYPEFFSALGAATHGLVMRGAGGVLISRVGALIGAVGVSGDSPDDDASIAIEASSSLTSKPSRPPRRRRRCRRAAEFRSCANRGRVR